MANSDYYAKYHYDNYNDDDDDGHDDNDNDGGGLYIFDACFVCRYKFIARKRCSCYVVVNLENDHSQI